MPPNDTPATPDPLARFTDPCGTYRTLADAHTRLVSGEQEAEFEYQGNGQTRRVKYSIANIAALERLMNEARAECAKLTGAPNPGRRFAIQAGGRVAAFRGFER